MRKLLIILLIIILLATFGVMITSGIKIGNFEIASFEKIIAENDQLDVKISELSASIEKDYKSAQSELNNSESRLKSAKQSYQDTIEYSSEEDIKAAKQLEKYKIDFLWTKIGMYSTKNNITMQANVSASSIQDLYNISFTVSGEYLNISEFVYAIENDSKLGFRIEDFVIVPYSANMLQATFTIRNVSIDRESLIAAGMTTKPTTTTTQPEQTQQDKLEEAQGQADEIRNTLLH